MSHNPNTGIKASHQWYAYHFGSRFVHSGGFDSDRLYGFKQDCYILMADLCSFTAFFKATENSAILEPLLRDFYSRARHAVLRQEGMLEKILGDSVVAVWGVHRRPRRPLDHIMRCAHLLATIGRDVCEAWQSQIDLVVEPKGIHMGLTKGEIIVSRRDSDYAGLSVLGNPINLCSRLQAAAQPFQLMCSNVVYRDLKATRHGAKLRPYAGGVKKGYLDARNYGRIKTWVMNIG